MRGRRQSAPPAASGEGGRLFQFLLPFVGGSLEKEDGTQRQQGSHPRQRVGPGNREMRDEKGEAAEKRPKCIQGEDGYPGAEAQIDQPMRGVIFARGSKGHQTPACPGNRNERGVEYGNAKDKEGNQP